MNKPSKEESVNYITYKRVIDLRNEELEILKKYDLKKAKYIYTGQCKESTISGRHSGFLWDIKNKITGNKNVHIYIETAIVYQNIIRFYKEEKNMSKKDVENFIFRNKKNFIICERGLTKKESKVKEQELYHSYLVESKLTNEIVLLKNRDSQLNEVENAIKLKSSRKKEILNLPSIKVTHKDNKFYLKLNDSECELIKINITPISDENDI